VFRLAIVEDDSVFQNELVRRTAPVQDFKIVGIFRNGEDFLSQVQKIKPDILFLDVGLPGISGIRVADCVRREFPFMEIVFITADEDHMKEAIRLYASDYITKPLRAERLIETLTRIKNKLARTDSKIELKSKTSTEILLQKEIFFVEALLKKTIVYTVNDTLTCLNPLKDLETALDKNMFFKTNRSFIVNLTWVESIKPASRTAYQVFFRGTNAGAYLQKNRYEEFRLRIKNLDRG